jgi:hypothetical protein
MTTSFGKTKDEVFKSLHYVILKPLGFKKKGLRSQINEGDLSRAILCWSNQWGNEFQILATVTHYDYLVFRYPQHLESFSNRLIGQNYPPLAEVSLKDLSKGSTRSWSLGFETSQATLLEISDEVKQVVSQSGLAILQQFRTLEGVLEFYQNQPNPLLKYEEYSWLLMYLNKKAEAMELVESAIKRAPHQNAKLFAEKWLERIKNG